MKIPILTYHKIGMPSSASTRRGLHTSRRALVKQLTFLARQGYAYCDFEDIALAARGERELPPRPILLTFDDGHIDNFTEGLPVLRDFGATATIFVVARDMGRLHFKWPEASEVEPMSLMNWDQAAEMQASGVRFEAHGWRHRRMDRLEPDELASELARCRTCIAERLGREPIALAYPDGSWNATCIELVREAGFSYACTTEERITDLEVDDPLALPRIPVKGYRRIHDWSFRRQLR